MVRKKKAGCPAAATGRARVRPHAVCSVRRDKAASPRCPARPAVPAPSSCTTGGYWGGPPSCQAAGESEEGGDQAAGHIGRGLRLDPHAALGVLEFSLNILKLRKVWTLGARNGVSS